MNEEVKIPKGLCYALEESRKSTYKHKLGACVMSGGRVLSRGYNSNTFNRTGSSKYTDYKISNHAERSAVSKLDKDVLKGTTIYIAREYSTGGWALARPCDCCLNMLVDLKLKKIIFSIPEAPFYEVIKL